MNIATRSIASSSASPARLTVLWFGLQLVWGAVLGLSLQARCVQLAGSQSLALFGVVSTAGAIVAAIVQLSVGPWSDARRRGGDSRALFYAAGVLVAAFSLLAFYLSPTVPLFIASFVTLQFGMNLAIGPYQAILPDAVAPSRIGAASGWMAAMQSVGNAGGAIAATLLGTTPMLAAVLAVVLLGSAQITLAHLRSIVLQPIAATAPRMHVTPSLVDLFISRALVYAGFYTLLGYFFFYVRAALPKHFPVDATTAAGIGILIFTIVGALGASIAARPADRVDERLVVTAGGAVIAGSIVFLAVGSSLWVAGIAIGGAGIGWGIFLCADWAFACRLLPPGSLATSMAVWNIAVIGPQILAPAITTLVLIRFHALATSAGPRDAFFMAALETLAGTLWIWRLRRQAIGK